LIVCIVVPLSYVSVAKHSLKAFSVLAESGFIMQLKRNRLQTFAEEAGVCPTIF